MAVSSLLVKKGDTIPNDIAALKGARLVFAAESAEGKKLDESLVKELTGREPISARFMRAEWFSFVPTFVPLLATNHKPIISGTDQAIWDRVCLIPFTRRFDGEGEDKDLVHTLRGELPGILLWIVRGAIEWQRHGLGEPEEVRAATAGYREESDRLAEFIAEECIEGPAFRVAMADLYKAYRSWGESRGEFPMGPRTFGERLRERGVQPAKGTGGKRMWLGIGVLRPQGASGRNGTGCRDPGEEADLP
jgi:putative DNA primase/helicase